MYRRIFSAIIIGVLCCLIAGSALADRLILIPTGSTLGTGAKAEYAASSDSGDGKVYWLHAGFSRFEVEGARFQDFGPTDEDAISLQVSLIPETSFTPALSVGVRDISDATDGTGALYDGRAFYLAASKSVPITGGIPVLFRDMKVHGGVGTGSLSGVFVGVEGTLPMGLRLAGEYDTENLNFALSYSVIPTLQARVYSIGGDIYYGGRFTLAF